MKKVPLSKLVSIVGGGTPSRDVEEYYNGHIPWLTVKDFGKQLFIDDAEEYITEKGLQESASSLIPAGNVIIATRMSVGSVAINRVNVAINQDLKALICKPELEPSFLLFYLLTRKKFLAAVANGATVKGITLDDLATLEIPLPPISKQQHIASILSEADRICKMRQHLQEMSDYFLQTVFIQKFVKNAQPTWPQTKIRDLALKMRTGPFGSQLLHSEFTSSGIAVLGIDNAVQNRFAWNEMRFISEEKYESLQRYKVHPNDVIITIMGTCGKCAIIPKDIPTSITTKHLCCITLDQKQCLPIYLHDAFLFHPATFHQLGISERGAVMPGLNMDIIGNISIPLPPLSLQEEYATFTTRYERLRLQQGEAYRQAEHLFQALLHQTFQES